MNHLAYLRLERLLTRHDFEVVDCADGVSLLTDQAEWHTVAGYARDAGYSCIHGSDIAAASLKLAKRLHELSEEDGAHGHYTDDLDDMIEEILDILDEAED